MNKLKVVSFKDRIEYNLNGFKHRPNGPAVVWDDGMNMWWLHGEPHRYYGPSDTMSDDWQVHGEYVK